MPRSQIIIYRTGRQLYNEKDSTTVAFGQLCSLYDCVEMYLCLLRVGGGDGVGEDKEIGLAQILSTRWEGYFVKTAEYL